MESKRDGFETGEFGRKLAMRLKGNLNFSVYYDHGDPKDDHVGSIMGFYGTEVHNSNRLTDIDVLVASSGKNARLLIEIEESPSSPKKILGDVMAALLCTRFAFKTKSGHEYFNITPDTHFIVAGYVSEQGIGIEKMDKIIAPWIRTFPAMKECISPANGQLIFQSTLEATIRELDRIVDSLIF